MRKPYQLPGSDEKLTLLYCPDRGSNSRPPALTTSRFEHGQGVPRRQSLEERWTFLVKVNMDFSCRVTMDFLVRGKMDVSCKSKHGLFL